MPEQKENLQGVTLHSICEVKEFGQLQLIVLQTR